MTNDEARVDPERRACEVLAAYFEAQQGGMAPPRHELLQLHPELATELGEFLDEQDRLLGLTDLMRSPGDDGPSGTRFGDYDLVAPIGRGGMGVVFKARQRSLNRPVALKLTLGGALAGTDDVRRFRIEAEAGAHLDHPNIVPIYEVGEHRGQGFLSMRLIEGGNLSDSWPRDGTDPQAAARLVATVARAVHHAHQRGILHRDLKPSNILLDHDSAPYVTDFGLARRVEGGDDLTRSGVIVGSPPYMAPEQAAGDRRAVTTATDVYGLGAILYWLLTGRAPFQGETAIEILDLVRGQAPAPPAALNPRVDRDLQTMCLKCLEKEPARRYASAEALADDLDHWLAGEPIAARPVGPAERARRWCRRNPVVAGLGASILFLLVTGFIGTVVGLVAIERQRAEAVRQRDQARIQREQARKAVDEMYTKVAEKWIGHEAGLTLLQKEFLQKALDYYQAFSAQHESDPATRMAAADAYRQIGVIRKALGESAADAYDKAIAGYTEVIRLDPKRAEAYNGRGMVWGHKGDHKRAVADYTEAIRLDPNLTEPYVDRGMAWKGKKDSARAIADLTEAIRLDPRISRAHINRGIAWREQKDFEKAIADFDEAVRLAPKSAGVYAQRAIAWRDQKDFARAMADLNEAIRLDPKSTEAYRVRGTTWRVQKQYDQALADYAEAIRLDPRSPEAYLNRGIAWLEKADYDRAIADLSEAIRLDPKSTVAYFNRGLTWSRKKNFPEAIADFNVALQLDPKFTPAQVNRDLVEAMADSTEAIRLKPKSPEVSIVPTPATAAEPPASRPE